MSVCERISNGRYQTKAGSTVVISGTYSGCSVVEFDWLEEPDACIECVVNPYPEFINDKWVLTWDCEECEGGSAELSPGDEPA